MINSRSYHGQDQLLLKLQNCIGKNQRMPLRNNFGQKENSILERRCNPYTPKKNDSLMDQSHQKRRIIKQSGYKTDQNRTYNQSKFIKNDDILQTNWRDNFCTKKQQNQNYRKQYGSYQRSIQIDLKSENRYDQRQNTINRDNNIGKKRQYDQDNKNRERVSLADRTSQIQQYSNHGQNQIQFTSRNKEGRRQFLEQAEEKLSNFQKRLYDAKVIHQVKSMESQTNLQNKHRPLLNIHNHKQDRPYQDLKKKYLSIQKNNKQKENHVDTSYQRVQLNQKQYSKIKQKYLTKNNYISKVGIEPLTPRQTNLQNNLQRKLKNAIQIKNVMDSKNSIELKNTLELKNYTFNHSQSTLGQQSSVDYSNKDPIKKNTIGIQRNTIDYYKSQYQNVNGSMIKSSRGNYPQSFRDVFDNTSIQGSQKTISKLKKINELNDKINDRIRNIINSFQQKERK